MKPSFVGKTYPGIINLLARSPDGTSLAVGGSSGVHVLDATSGMRMNGVEAARKKSERPTSLASDVNHPLARSRHIMLVVCSNDAHSIFG